MLTGVPAVVDNLGPPHAADPESPDVTRLQALSAGPLRRKHGAADGRFYSAAGIDAVIFGPGGAGQHGPSEYVDLRTVRPYREALIGFLRGL